MVYKNKEYKPEYTLWYWENVKNKELFNPKLISFFDDIMKQLSIEGINKTIKKDNLKSKYNKYCN